MRIKKIVILLVSLPKTIYFNFRVLPLRDAFKMPILVGHKTKFGILNRNVTVPSDSKMFQIRLNWLGTESREEGRKGYISIGKKGQITFRGKSHFSSGLSLVVDCGELEIGDRFFCNKNCCISCNSRIYIGDDAMWGWNVELLDSDNHESTYKGITKSSKAPITIGEHVWLASYVNILKGVDIAKGSIVAYRSLVLNSLMVENSLYGGSPAKIISTDILWNKKSANL